ncbi:FAD-dependent oxidoreductase [Massilia glaciei]|uniref:FAD-dependent oxidoreductase n=1 Tax=Massilia glaciei TaxID=1524097 RepID=A0A2U2HFA2_9BURK|nr:FAD-dependent oxidoreductase [Massilia glaciei]PWF42720.1 FAD-dependent oxidoreductase [Massilia glaciei]
MTHIDCDIAVIGASLGGVMAAWQAAGEGRKVVLAAEFDWLGGQLTSQGVPPDEHPLIESGGASDSYRAMRAALRDLYLNHPEFSDNSVMTEGCNPGDGWVSRLCIEPRLAADYIEQLLAPLVGSGDLRIERGVRLLGARREGRRIVEVQLQDSADNAIGIRAAWFLDATDTGALIKAADLPYRLGKEAHAEFGEPDAPLEADRLDQQPVTMVMALRRTGSDNAVGAAPPDYGFWVRHALPHYDHLQFGENIPGSGRGQSVKLPLFGSGDTLDMWRYRRVVCAHNWQPPRREVSLVNWAQNDYGLHPLLDGPFGEAEVVRAARDLSLCLLHWLRTEAPRPDGALGYPELAPAPDVLGSADGLAQQVYVRESRRIVGLECLSQTDIALGAAGPVPTTLANSVGVAWYNLDIHPTCVSGHGVNARVRPFCLPLGSFIPRDCDNLIPACKNIGITHLVNACTRVHPAEWLIGEVAGLLAAFAMDSGRALADIHADPSLVRRFQTRLKAAGIPLSWNGAQLASLPHNSH